MTAHDVIIWASFVGVMIEASGPDRWGKIDLDVWVLNPAIFRYSQWDDLVNAIDLYPTKHNSIYDWRLFPIHIMIETKK